jgi:antitoxin VapB
MDSHFWSSGEPRERSPEQGSGHARHVKLFRNGQNQAVRIPREFELPGTDAIIRKEGERLILEPAPPQGSLAAHLAVAKTWKYNLGEDEKFPVIDDPRPGPVDL